MLPEDLKLEVQNMLSKTYAIPCKCKPFPNLCNSMYIPIQRHPFEHEIENICAKPTEIHVDVNSDDH